MCITPGERSVTRGGNSLQSPDPEAGSTSSKNNRHFESSFLYLKNVSNTRSQIENRIFKNHLKTFFLIAYFLKNKYVCSIASKLGKRITSNRKYLPLLQHVLPISTGSTFHSGRMYFPLLNYSSENIKISQ